MRAMQVLNEIKMIRGNIQETVDALNKDKSQRSAMDTKSQLLSDDSSLQDPRRRTEVLSSHTADDKKRGGLGTSFPTLPVKRV